MSNIEERRARAITTLRDKICKDALDLTYTVEETNYIKLLIAVKKMWRTARLIERLQRGEDPRLLVYSVVADDSR